MEKRVGITYFDVPTVPVKIKVAKVTDVSLHTLPVLIICSRAAGALGSPQQSFLLLAGISRIQEGECSWFWSWLTAITHFTLAIKQPGGNQHGSKAAAHVYLAWGKTRKGKCWQNPRLDSVHKYPPPIPDSYIHCIASLVSQLCSAENISIFPPQCRSSCVLTGEFRVPEEGRKPAKPKGICGSLYSEPFHNSAREMVFKNSNYVHSVPC